MGILKDRTEDATDLFRVRLPKDLLSELEAVQKAAKEAGKEFPTAEIVSKALIRAINGAKKELGLSIRASRKNAQAGA